MTPDRWMGLVLVGSVVPCTAACSSSSSNATGNDAGVAETSAVDGASGLDGGLNGESGKEAGTDASTPPGDGSSPEGGNTDSGPTQPVELAAGSGAWGIAVDSTNVYWTDVYDQSRQGDVLAIPISGGTPRTIASPAGYVPSSLQVSKTQAYWTAGESGSVFAAPLHGGAAQTLYASVNGWPEWSIALGTDAVYWAMFFQVLSAPLDGGNPTTLASGLTDARAIAVNSNAVYWAEAYACPSDGGACDPQSGTIKSVPLQGGSVTTIAANRASAWRIAIDSTSIYWTDEGLLNQGFSSPAVLKVPLAGGTPQTLATGASDYRGIAVDGTFVYWLTAGTSANNYFDGTVMKVPIAGGTATTLASGQKTPWAITVDATNIYWTNAGTPPSYVDGSVMRLAKQ